MPRSQAIAGRRKGGEERGRGNDEKRAVRSTRVCARIPYSSCPFLLLSPFPPPACEVRRGRERKRKRKEKSVLFARHHARPLRSINIAMPPGGWRLPRRFLSLSRSGPLSFSPTVLPHRRGQARPGHMHPCGATMARDIAGSPSRPAFEDLLDRAR